MELEELSKAPSAIELSKAAIMLHQIWKLIESKMAPPVSKNSSPKGRERIPKTNKSRMFWVQHQHFTAKDQKQVLFTDQSQKFMVALNVLRRINCKTTAWMLRNMQFREQWVKQTIQRIEYETYFASCFLKQNIHALYFIFFYVFFFLHKWPIWKITA